MTSLSLQVLHVAAHLDAIETSIVPVLKAGTPVILDRYWWSTWVYGRAAGIEKRSLRKLIDFERYHWGAVRPPIVFLIHRQKANDKYALTSKGPTLWTDYLEIARRQGAFCPVHIIENDNTIEQALDSITMLINSIGNKRKEDRSLRRIEADGEETLIQVHSTEQGSVRTSIPATRLGKGVLHTFTRSKLPRQTEVFDTYWRFAAERQAIFFRKLQRSLSPWTEDPILSRYKFTNAYRASDRVSQFLISSVIYVGDQSIDEVFFRTILFKTFNRIETWELLERAMGIITYRDYSFENYESLLSTVMDRGEAIYSPAYIMPSGNNSFGYSQKHRNHLKLLEKMMREDVPQRLLDLRSMRRAFELLRSYPMIGDFLAYQYLIDLNYSDLLQFSEMEFVVPGPGALDGISKCFQSLDGLTEANLIRMVTENQEDEFERRGIHFDSLWGRPLQLVDCQSLFCEVDKYARLAHPETTGKSNRTRIKQGYRPSSNWIDYWYPPKWGLNARIEAVRATE